MSYVIGDWETTTKTSFKRKANPFDQDNRVVAWGLKYPNKNPETYYEQSLPKGWLDGVKIFVAHNAKFDMTWIWRDPEWVSFLKRGGKIWCTQYAEYILTGQTNLYPSLDECSLKYGGELKNDEIKAMWEAGIDTPDIPRDMLCDYLIGDICNTEIVYKAQVRRARELGMINTMLTHMEALLGLTEMEYNGLCINKELGETHIIDLENKLVNIKMELDEYIPKDLPDEVTFNWGSGDHLSALLFGGGIKYKKRVHQMDEEGKLLYTKASQEWPLIDGEPVDPDVHTDSSLYDRYKSGKKVGKVKYKKVPAQGEPKMKYEDFVFNIDGCTNPDESWKTKKEGVYKTDDDVLGILANRGVVFAKLMRDWRKLDKDLGTYYKRYDPKKKCDVGMLTLIQPDGLIHHKLNNCATATGRLSSSDPNGQNIPRADKSKVKQLFISRFGDNGRMSEVDFSQLEVICQGLESKDPQLIRDIVDGVDFHCVRGAKKMGISYETFYKAAKIDELPEYKAVRQGSKEFSFQRAYGAGALAISAATGMSVDEIKEFIKAEEEMYPGVVAYNDSVMNDVESTRKPTKQQVEVDGKVCNIGKGFYISPTGKRYVFSEEVAPKFLRQPPAWKKQKPKLLSFKPTQTKNYPIQGIAGEIILLCIGKLFREFLSRDNFDNRAFLVSTVHDCIWTDSHKDVCEEATKLVYDTLVSADKLLEGRYGFKCPVVFRAEAEMGLNMYDLKGLHYD